MTSTTTAASAVAELNAMALARKEHIAKTWIDVAKTIDDFFKDVLTITPQVADKFRSFPNNYPWGQFKSKIPLPPVPNDKKAECEECMKIWESNCPMLRIQLQKLEDGTIQFNLTIECVVAQSPEGIDRKYSQLNEHLICLRNAYCANFKPLIGDIEAALEMHKDEIKSDPKAPLTFTPIHRDLWPAFMQLKHHWPQRNWFEHVVHEHFPCIRNVYIDKRRRFCDAFQLSVWVTLEFDL